MTTEHTPPVQIIIDGAASPMAFEIVRAADTEADVQIVGVAGPVRAATDHGMSSEQSWQSLLRHDTVRGRFEPKGEVPYFEAPDAVAELRQQHPDAVVIAIGATAAGIAKAYGDSDQLPPRLLVADSPQWARRTYLELPHYVLGDTEELYWPMVDDTMPLSLPAARHLALLPLLTDISFEEIQTHETAVQAQLTVVADSGNEHPLDLAYRRAQGVSSIPLPPAALSQVQSQDEVLGISGYKGLPCLRERVISVPGMVGSILDVTVRVERSRGERIREVQTELWDETTRQNLAGTHNFVDRVVAAIDAKGESKTQVTAVKRETRGSDVIFDTALFYDERWLRANRALDLARLAVERTAQV